MITVEENLANWRASLLSSIPVAGLYARNPVAHKWKAPFRSMTLREAAFWRVTDLLTQSYALHQQGHGLGARILLRSGIETLAILIHLNQITGQVLDGTLNFHEFSQKTSTLLLGSKDNSTSHVAVNIMTVLRHCDKRYPGLMGIYAILSESAHPNYGGLCTGYSTVDRDATETHFSNRWMDLYGDRHIGSLELCIATFQLEYDVVWLELMEKLEAWIATNDAHLEATKDDPLPGT